MARMVRSALTRKRFSLSHNSFSSLSSYWHSSAPTSTGSTCYATAFLPHSSPNYSFASLSRRASFLYFLRWFCKGGDTKGRKVTTASHGYNYEPTSPYVHRYSANYATHLICDVYGQKNKVGNFAERRNYESNKERKTAKATWGNKVGDAIRKKLTTFLVAII